MEFDRERYIAPETRLIRADLTLSRGIFSSPITVGVIPSEQSPVSAEGDFTYS